MDGTGYGFCFPFSLPDDSSPIGKLSGSISSISMYSPLLILWIKLAGIGGRFGVTIWCADGVTACPVTWRGPWTVEGGPDPSGNVAGT